MLTLCVIITLTVILTLALTSQYRREIIILDSLNTDLQDEIEKLQLELKDYRKIKAEVAKMS